MYEWLTQFAQENFCVQLAETGMSEAEHLSLEKALGIPLPLSYKRFLHKWNGCDLNGDIVFSNAKLQKAVEEYGFRPFSGELERTNGDNYLYKAKPAHCLPFCQLVLSADLYCFDTRPVVQYEYSICRYDHEDGDIENLLRMRFPSFEAFLLFKTFHLTADLEYFLTPDMEESDEEFARAEKRLEEWQYRLRLLLKERGADFRDNEWWPTWQNWTYE